MAVASHQCADIRQAVHYHGQRGFCFRPIPELAFFVVAPAFNRSIRQQSACVVPSRCQRNDISQTVHRNGRKGICFRSIPKLASLVVAPAFHGLICEYRAGMTRPRTKTVALETPRTATVVGASVVVPSPSWPCELSPQHLTVLSGRMTQAWPPIVEIVGKVIANGGVGVVTAGGVEGGVIVEGVGLLPSPLLHATSRHVHNNNRKRSIRAGVICRGC